MQQDFNCEKNIVMVNSLVSDT